MHFPKAALLPLFAASAFAVTSQDVLNDLKQVDTDTNTLASQFNSYTGAGSQTLQLRSTFSKLTTDVQKATSDANAAPVPSVADGTTIYNYVNGQLYTDSKNAQTAVQNKKATITSAGVLQEVCDKTKSLRTLVASLSDALIAKAPNADLKSKGTTTKANYDKTFAATLTFLGCK